MEASVCEGRSPALSRSIFVVFSGENGQKSIIEDGLFQGFAWEASSRSPSLVGPLFVSRSIFACGGKQPTLIDGRRPFSKL